MLIELKLRPPHTHLDETAIINYTQVHIPEDIKMVLSWGRKFVFPSDKMSPTNFIPEIDALIDHRLPTVLQNEAKRVSAIIMQRHAKRNHRETDVWLRFLHMRTTDFIGCCDDIVITQSDGGKHSVVMYSNEYKGKMSELLSDSHTYERTNVDTQLLIERSDRCIHELMGAGAVDRAEAGRLSDGGTALAKIYSLPKVHKESTPLRPVTSTHASPGRNLAGKLVEWLTPFFRDERLHIDNSEECKRMLKDIKLEPDDGLVSFDVVSMFTNIPTELAIECVMSKADEIGKSRGISPELLSRLLKFTLQECSFFTYEMQTYKQVTGLPMGSPTSPLMTRAVMSDLINKQKPKMLVQPKFLGIYVDDTISVIHKDYAECALRTLNNYNERIKFIMKLESGRKNNFLEMTLHRENDHIVTNWYGKEYASQRILNYLSGHTHSTIMNVTKAHIRTVLTLSDPEFFWPNHRHVTNRLRLNNFPETEILCLMNSNYTLMRPTTNNVESKNQIPQYGAIQHVKCLTGSIGAAPKTLTPNISIMGKPDRSKDRWWTNLKDKTPPEEGTNKIILLKCNCGQKSTMEYTKYKERGREAVTRLMQNLKMGTNCRAECHTYDTNKFEIMNGAGTWQKTKTKAGCMAYSRGTHMNKDAIPNINWRHQLEKNGRKRKINTKISEHLPNKRSKQLRTKWSNPTKPDQ